jgi:hypothetical protein
MLLRKIDTKWMRMIFVIYRYQKFETEAYKFNHNPDQYFDDDQISINWFQNEKIIIPNKFFFWKKMKWNLKISSSDIYKQILKTSKFLNKFVWIFKIIFSFSIINENLKIFSHNKQTIFSSNISNGVSYSLKIQYGRWW